MFIALQVKNRITHRGGAGLRFNGSFSVPLGDSLHSRRSLCTPCHSLWEGL